MRRRRRISLTVRVSGLLIFAAILPLFIIIITDIANARQDLIKQANIAMQSDARTRTQLINAYFTERLLDAATLSQVPTVQSFLVAPRPTQSDILHASYALVAGSVRDNRYITWTPFDARGHLRLFYPRAPQAHGKVLVPPGDLQAVTAGKPFISPVYFDPKTQKATVDIYHPIRLGQSSTLIGFVRSTLNLDYIWGIVHDDQGANGSGSYAFILDQNGVRIADTDPTRLFSAVAPLPAQAQELISSEARYGNQKQVPVITDTTLASLQQHSQASKTFPITPSGQSATFQGVQQSIALVPWNYFVLSPDTTVTAVADQQLYITIGVAGVALLLAAFVGILLGRRLTSPIMSSVDSLRGNSESLKTLAAKQQNAAREQMWVVDSSQVGLQSVQYYSDATRVAARQLSEISFALAQRWYALDAQAAGEALERLTQIAQYIENAAHYQGVSIQKLSTAIKVTSQVTEQLATGATSAGDASNRLERVVNQLRGVVGK